MLDNPTLVGGDFLFSKASVLPLLRALEKSPNFKTKIHALTTLIKLADGLTYKDDDLFKEAWISLVNCLEQHNKAVYSNLAEQRRYSQNLDSLMFALWEKLASQVQSCSEYASQLKAFVNENSLALLTTIVEYLRKELKVPEYSELFDDKEQLTRETQALFEGNEKLAAKLGMLRSAIASVRDLIKASEDVHVSFGVFESLSSLADSDVTGYRLLSCLKTQKTSFQPSFDDHSSSSASV